MDNICILNAAKDMQTQLSAWRRAFHACPELGLATIQTEALIVSYLEEIGVTDIRRGIGGHGVAALIVGELPGKCLMVRADTDALPILEQTGLPFASQNGAMHACGHDGHIAMNLGAAKLLMQRRSELAGSVLLIFQPGEEIDAGANAMIADGVMDSPEISAAIALHTGNIMGEQYRLGDVVHTPFPISAGLHEYRITFHGRGAHVCSPHLSIDPVLMACNAVVQIQSLLSRERDPYEVAICGATTIHGGTQCNIIPDSCVIEGSIRAFDDAVISKYVERVKEICNAVALSMRGTAEFETIHQMPETVIDGEMYNKFLKIAEQIVPKSSIKQLSPAPPIGEDFARFAALVPSMHFYLCSRPEASEVFPHHHPKFDLDERALPTGAALLAGFALNWQN